MNQSRQNVAYVALCFFIFFGSWSGSSAAANRPPSIASISNQTLVEGEQLILPVGVRDKDQDSITLSSSTDFPWMAIQDAQIRLAPTVGDAGSYLVTVRASDDRPGGIDSESFRVDILSSNTVPQLVVAPTVEVDEGDTVAISVSASDPDGDVFTLSTKGLRRWMDFDGQTLTLSPGPIDTGVYPVGILADDGTGVSIANVLVIVGSTNQTPVFEPLLDQTLREGDSGSYRVRASDPDGATVNITAIGLAPWMTFDGFVLEMNPAYDDAGVYEIIFTVMDGALSASASLTVTVENTNQAPTLAVASSVVVGEDNSLSVPIAAVDPDGDAVSLSIRGLRQWMSFDGSTLMLTPGFEDAGSYLVTVRADDGSMTSSTEASVVVGVTNRAPVLPALDELLVGEGRLLLRELRATDADGDAISMELSGAEPWVMLEGQRMLVVEPPAGTAGTYVFSVLVTDGKDTSESLVTLSVSSESGSSASNWTEFFGSQDKIAPWSGWVRGVGRGATGMDLYEDPYLIDELIQDVGNVIATHDAMMPAILTGEEFAGSYYDLIHDGGTEIWKQVVKDQIHALSHYDPTGSSLYYQLGNEITSQDKSDHLRAWAATRGIDIPGESIVRDPEAIPYYIEYKFAPAVEAIKEASLDIYGDADRIPIVLGSIGNASIKKARDWLRELLSYEIQGTFAPSLQGMSVFELVNIITVHYVGPTQNLEQVWSEWEGVGAINGVWTTEEIGARVGDDGLGAATALRTVGRHMTLFARRGLTPERARVNFWGWNINAESRVPDTSADASMSRFYDFFGDAPLDVLDPIVAELNVQDVDDPEIYVYRAPSATEKLAVTVTATTTSDGAFRGIRLPKSVFAGTWTGELSVFSAAGMQTSLVGSVDGGGPYIEISVDPVAFEPGARTTLLLTLERL